MTLVYEFEIPKNTPESNTLKKSYDLGVNGAVIKSLKVRIPKGHKGLTYLNVRIPSKQLLPSSFSNVYFVRGDNEIKETGVINVRVDGPPYNLLVEGYNEDTFLNHSFIIEVEI